MPSFVGAAFPGKIRFVVAASRLQSASLPRADESLVVASTSGSLGIVEIVQQVRRLFGPFGGLGGKIFRLRRTVTRRGSPPWGRTIVMIGWRTVKPRKNYKKESEALQWAGGGVNGVNPWAGKRNRRYFCGSECCRLPRPLNRARVSAGTAPCLPHPRSSPRPPQPAFFLKNRLFPSRIRRRS